MTDELAKLRNIMSREIVGELRTHAVIQQGIDTIFDRAATEIVQLRQQVTDLLGERDEARRECCRWMAEAEGGTPEEHAQEQGWDCFKEKP